ncbi:MAG: ISAzo13 family transposase [Methanosarcinales archaeon]
MEESVIKKIHESMKGHLNERQQRLLTASMANAIGYGGISTLSRMTGMSRTTITSGRKELETPEECDIKKVRREGGGRKKIADIYQTIMTDLENLVEPVTRGDPESPLRWSCKSTRKLAQELNNMGHKASHSTVAVLLSDLGYSLQGNKKIIEGESHPDRNAQFEYINNITQEYQQNGQPVISVDTKKKELVGDFKNGRREYRRKGDPERVRSHDFKIKELGKVNPYGVYDQTRNEGWVNVGIDHDTSAFAVESIRQWWNSMGQKVYPDSEKLLNTADSGGSNGYRVRLWKIELQKFADETGLEIAISHFPSGTSKWNKIEHRLFSFTQNWSDKPLISHEVIVNLISATTTNKGLLVKCQLDKKSYPKGIKISDEIMEQINIIRSDFHGEWHYTILPKHALYCPC